MKGGISVFAAGCLHYKNKRLLWYQNRRQSLSLSAPGTPRRGRSSTQSAHQFGKPTAMPRDVVNVWSIHFIFTCLAEWATLTKAGRDSLLNSVMSTTLGTVSLYRLSQLDLVALKLKLKWSWQLTPTVVYRRRVWKTPLRFARVRRKDPQLASKRSDSWLSGLKVKVFLKRQHEAGGFGHVVRQTDRWTDIETKQGNTIDRVPTWHFNTYRMLWRPRWETDEGSLSIP